MLKTSNSFPSTRIVIASRSLWWVFVRTLNLLELLSLVTLLFLHFILLSRNLFLKRIDVFAITYLLLDVVLATPRTLASTSDRPHRHCKFCKKPSHDISKCYRKQRFEKKETESISWSSSSFTSSRYKLFGSLYPY
jgi:hypothetical protein